MNKIYLYLLDNQFNLRNLRIELLFWDEETILIMDSPKNFNFHKLSFNKQKYSDFGWAATHPAIQIYAWICLVLLVQLLHGFALMMLAGVLIVFSLRICPQRFYILLRRTRWILLSVMLIYAYAGSSAGIWPQLGAYSPVVDGVVDGFMQILRLLTVLAALSVLLSFLSQQQLISGLYSLSRPLSYFGLPRERVAVRLALCMHYAESAMQDTANNWQETIAYLLVPVQVEAGVIELEIGAFSRKDWMLGTLASAMLVGVWL